MPRKKSNFGTRFDSFTTKNFSDGINGRGKKELGNGNPYQFEAKDQTLNSLIRFYDHDSAWTRWRRGYELYTLTQTYFGSNATNRNRKGDFRMYCAYQQFPGVFISARMFMFPSTNTEIGEQMVGVRDVNSFSFYTFGLPIQAVRYMTKRQTGTYLQSGTNITVTLADHNYEVGDSVYLFILSGGTTNGTFVITATTQNTFEVTSLVSISTSGTLEVQKQTTFADPAWDEQRVQLRFIPTPVTFFRGERLADRVVERDPGILSTYSRTGTLVTVDTTQPHGLSSGNEVFLAPLTGAFIAGLYKITVTSSTQFTVESLLSGTTSGQLIVNRRLRGYRYDDYVGYTVTGTDLTSNEVLFQRADSYGAVTNNTKTNVLVPAPRGFEVGRFLTTEIRYQCTCSDFMRRENFDLYKEAGKRRFPRTPLTSVKEGTRINRDGQLVDTQDDVGVFGSLGYQVINNFYQLPEYEDLKEFSYNNLFYYQMRWCKHIYAAMWSVVHDEGNNKIDITARYEQSGGPNITVFADNHGLSANRRIQLDITSGNAISEEYVITQILDNNSFLVVSPIALTTSGYCVVRNIRNHEYVGAWLLEPSDQPIGDALEKFYERFEKEFERTAMQLERMKMMGYGMPWTGSIETTGSRNQPEQVANFLPNLMTMMATDSIRRDKGGNLDRAGTAQNRTTTTLYMFQKLLNIPINLLNDAKFGMLDQPLTDYTPDFQFAQIDCGSYRNGVPVDDGTTDIIDCETYSPPSIQFIIIDCGLYLNS